MEPVPMAPVSGFRITQLVQRYDWPFCSSILSPSALIGSIASHLPQTETPLPQLDLGFSDRIASRNFPQKGYFRS